MDEWQQLAAAQEGAIARRQLLALGCSRHFVRRQLDARRWIERTSTVLSVTTGPPTWRQSVWAAVLHAGGDALVGGLTALEWHGLRNWHRDEITVLVDDQLSFDPVAGVTFFRTRRPLVGMRASADLPFARIEPASLLFAGYERSARTGQGLLAAVIQQRLTTASSMQAALEQLRPLRRARLFRTTLGDIAGGAQSLAEIDIARICRSHDVAAPARQTRRRDSSGRIRFTDCEWQLPGGRILILEIDGAFHMDVEHWEDDLARQRGLSSQGRIVVRCTARELRERPDSVLGDLKRHGLCA
ncbi:MAG TPA: hypothetical protein VFE15_17260 [Marmoricola sp.]|jgi:hypothetical protein|nr:hypothetical protein [Marmoricola sp.]